MTRPERTPNRVLDLAELDEPFFRRCIGRMDELTALEEVSYLHPSKRWEYPWALERAALAPGSRVLDAGCGASIFPVYLCEMGYRVSAVDLHPPADLARLHRMPIDYVSSNITELPFEEASFDAVFCISVIEHLGHEGALAALRELRRVVRPGGNVLVTTDYYRDAGAELWYERDGERFAVDWSFFDEERLHRYVLDVPGLCLVGELDLYVDWERTEPVMRRFHGYPYTAVGVMLQRRI